MDSLFALLDLSYLFFDIWVDGRLRWDCLKLCLGVYLLVNRWQVLLNLLDDGFNFLDLIIIFTLACRVFEYVSYFAELL